MSSALQPPGVARTRGRHSHLFTWETHLATSIAVNGIAVHGKRVRFYSTVDLVNVFEQEKRDGKAGRAALSLMRMDLAVLDELGSMQDNFS